MSVDETPSTVHDPTDRAAAFDQAPWPAMIVTADDLVVAASFGLGAARERSALGALSPCGETLLRLVRRARRDNASVREAGVDLPCADGRTRESEAAAAPLRADAVLVSLHVPMDGGGGPSAQMLPAAAGLGRTLAHEVKNPLAGIRGAAQLLRSAASGSDVALAQLIMDETDRIRRLVDEVETLSDDRAPVRRRINLHRVLERVRALIHAAAPALTVRERYDPSLPHAGGDEDQLVQLFLNLAKNAAEAASLRERGGGEVVIATAYRHGARARSADGADWRATPLEVRIEDNGPGVPPEMRHCLFDPFVTGKSMGTGLGLTIAAKLAAAHGGVLDFQSQPGRTVFRVLLPVDRGTEAATASSDLLVEEVAP